MLFALKPYGEGLNPDVLLIYVPGHTKENIRKIPFWSYNVPNTAALNASIPPSVFSPLLN